MHRRPASGSLAPCGLVGMACHSPYDMESRVVLVSVSVPERQDHRRRHYQQYRRSQSRLLISRYNLCTPVTMHSD